MQCRVFDFHYLMKWLMLSPQMAYEEMSDQRDHNLVNNHMSKKGGFAKQIKPLLKHGFLYKNWTD